MATHRTIKDVTYFPKGTRRYNLAHQFENAGLAQIVTRTLLAPIERWKLFSQTQRSIASMETKYSSFADFVKGILKSQGPAGLLRGNSASIWIYIYQLGCQHLFYQNVNNGVNQLFQKGYSLEDYSENTGLKNLMKVLSLSFLTLIFTYPIETARVRMALNTPGQMPKELPFKGVYDCLRYTSLFNRQGFRKNTYRGFLFGNFTSLTYMATYSLCYRGAQEPGVSDRKQFNLLPITLLGTLPAILVTYPLDTIKHQLQLNQKNKGNLKSARDTVRQIMRRGEVTELYRGLLPSLTKHLLSAPIFFGILNIKYSNGLNYF